MTGRHRRDDTQGDGTWSGMPVKSRLILAGYVAVWLATLAVGVVALARGGQL